MRLVNKCIRLVDMSKSNCKTMGEMIQKLLYFKLQCRNYKRNSMIWILNGKIKKTGTRKLIVICWRLYQFKYQHLCSMPWMLIWKPRLNQRLVRIFKMYSRTLNQMLSLRFKALEISILRRMIIPYLLSRTRRMHLCRGEIASKRGLIVVLGGKISLSLLIMR